MSITLNVTSFSSCLKIGVLDNIAEVSVAFNPETFETKFDAQVFYRTDVRVFDTRTGKDLTWEIQKLMKDNGVSPNWEYVEFHDVSTIVHWTEQYLSENE